MDNIIKIKVKNIRYFCNDINTIEWNKDECLHSAKCIKHILYNFEYSSGYTINVSDKQYESLLNQMDVCPEGALKLKDI